MPFDVGESINYIADAFLRAPFVHGTAKNPIYTAMLVTLILVLIIMFIFRGADTEDPLLTMALRSGFWIFLALAGVLFLHDKILLQDASAHERDEAAEKIFAATSAPTSSVYRESLVPVQVPVPTQ